jgi:tetratricopeptide (TPR) repeat protein
LVVEQSPKNDVGHYRLALAYNKLGEPVLAQTHADQAEIWKEKRLKFSEMHMEAVNRPLDAELRVQIGQAALELDRPELAQNWFQAALAINPQHPSAAEGLAKARAAEER